MPSKKRAVLTSTIAATPRLLLRTPPEPAHHRYAGLAEPRSRNRGLSSPAGLHRRPWLARLRRALEEGLFVLHYQPIMSLQDGSVSHYGRSCGSPTSRGEDWWRPAGSCPRLSAMG